MFRLGRPALWESFARAAIEIAQQGTRWGAGIAKTRAIEANSYYMSNKSARSFEASKVFMNDLASALPKPKDG